MFLTENDPYEERLARFREIIRDGSRIVFFGGAGVSTASGIPDFRSTNGLYNVKDAKYNTHKPEYYLSGECLAEEPETFFAFLRDRMDCRNVEPNIIHKYLAKLEQDGKLSGVVTQNIDMLHEKAGTQNVFTIHGSFSKCHCMSCQKVYGTDYIFDRSQSIPTCECGGVVRPDVTLYGEELPDYMVEKALDAIQHADCLIIAGTSLAVMPAAGFVSYFQGRDMVIMNQATTAYDQWADVVFREDMAKVFADVAELERREQEQEGLEK